MPLDGDLHCDVSFSSNQYEREREVFQNTMYERKKNKKIS
jgi:hypothetical protein